MENREMTDEAELCYNADLICPSCRKIFNIPLFLPCSHSLCQTCILSARKLSGQKSHQDIYSQPSLNMITIDCPICWLPVELPSPDWETVLEFLPVNWTIKGILDCYRPRTTCNDHGKRWRLFFCERTGTFVCRACRPNLLEDDSVVTLEDAWAARKEFVINTLLIMKDGDGNLTEQNGRQTAAEILAQDQDDGQYSYMARHCNMSPVDNARMSTDHLRPETLKSNTATTNRTLMGRLVNQEDLRIMLEKALQKNDLVRLLEVARLCSMECAPLPDSYSIPDTGDPVEVLEEDLETALKVAISKNLIQKAYLKRTDCLSQWCGLTFRLAPASSHPLLSVSSSGLQMKCSEAFALTPDVSCCRDQSYASTAWSGSLSASLPSPSVSSLILGESNASSDIRPERGLIQFPMVLGDVTIKNGIFYWEVDVSNSHFYNIGVCTKRMSSSCNLKEQQSWYLQQLGSTFSVFYDGYTEQLDSMPLHVKKIGVCINYTGGTLSFYNAVAQEHLCTIPTRFLQHVNPAFSLAEGSLSILCGLPVPDFVFSIKGNIFTEKVPETSWHHDVAFPSVVSFIQKFEDLTVTDSDSGLISSNYGSCSTLNSWSGASSFDHPGLNIHIIDD